jgi:hypothetical protein
MTPQPNKPDDELRELILDGLGEAYGAIEQAEFVLKLIAQERAKKDVEARIDNYKTLAWNAMREDKHGFKTGEIGQEVIRQLKAYDTGFQIEWLYSLDERQNSLRKLKAKELEADE